VFQLAIGDAEHAQPRREHDLVALSVALERQPVAMGAPAVELRNELVGGPVDVGDVAVDGDVRQRLRELRVRDQLEELAFPSPSG
jgi:hypothetical protein